MAGALPRSDDSAQDGGLSAPCKQTSKPTALHHQAHEISVIQGYLAVTLCIIPIIGVVINGMLLIGILVENN